MLYGDPHLLQINPNSGLGYDTGHFLAQKTIYSDLMETGWEHVEA